MPLDKYAKRNSEDIGEEENVVGVFTLAVPTIDQTIRSEEPPQKVAPSTVTNSEDDDTYEQISIFDVIDE
jgi:hypothetical protein